MLSWNPAEEFDPSWVTNDAFLWDSDVVPECSGVMRLVLWWIYAYGKDVINVPFHKFYSEGADDNEKLSVYEGGDSAAHGGGAVRPRCGTHLHTLSGKRRITDTACISFRLGAVEKCCVGH